MTLAVPKQPGRSRSGRGGVKGVRITDVAAAAGVSAITVSRVFNQPETVAPETLARVRQVVAQLGYVPNRLAGGLSSARSRLVAAIVPTIAHSLFAESIQAFSDTMARAGYEVMLGLSSYSDINEDQLLDAVLSRRPEGVLLTGVSHSAGLRARLTKIGIPIIETWDLTDDPIDMLVGFSHREVGMAVAEFFMARGRRCPALISATDSRAQARRAGYLEALARHGFADVPQVLVTPPSSVAAGKASLTQLLAQAPGVDAVFCGSDLLALGVVGQARAQHLAVPEQLAVCGFGDLEFAAEIQPPLTSVRVDGRRIGESAARALLERLGGATQAPILDVGFSIVARATT
jgi:LacI family gluconate utilization system Gnt-I transcriptional repressor